MTEKILNLCRDISLPEEMIIQIPEVWADFDMSSLPITGLMTQGQEENAYNSLVKTFADTDKNGIKMLTCQLYAMLQIREKYVQKGISDQIFIDTMKSFTRFIGEYFNMHGRYVFERGWWTWRHLSMRMFRLGVLEFEPKDGDLWVHIPSDAVMTKEALRSSYDFAKAFFTEQGIPFSEIVCSTWLLSPALRDILPPDSRILNFQNDYEILEVIPKNNYFMRWVFNKEYGQDAGDLTKLPENTSLQRGVKKLLLEGKTVGDARGRYMY